MELPDNEKLTRDLMNVSSFKQSKAEGRKVKYMKRFFPLICVMEKRTSEVNKS